MSELEEHTQEHTQFESEDSYTHSNNTGEKVKEYAKQCLELAKTKGGEYAILLAEEFNRHPKKYKMNCGEHFFMAMKSSLWSMGAAVVFAVHAVFPMMFQTTGSSIISSLNKTFDERCKADKEE